jgi:hypothetical protein
MRLLKEADEIRATLRIGELVKEHAGLLRLTISEHADIEFEDIQELFSSAKEIMNNKPFCLLTDARTPLTASKEAREYAANHLRLNNVIANAILSDSLPGKLIVNFYIRINRPEVPTQMFNNEAKAIAWLEVNYKGF